MAVDIPVPNMSRWGDYSDILQNLMQNRMKQQEEANLTQYRQGSLQQQAKDLAQRTAYENALLGFKKQEEQRAAQKAIQEQMIAQRLFGGTNQEAVTPTDAQNIAQMKPGDSYVVGKNQGLAQQSSETPQKTNLKDMQSRLDSGEEFIVKPGDMSRAQWNKFAGSKLMGIKIPDIRSQIVDGVQYNTYPNGEVRAIKVGMTPTEKEQSKSDVKISGDIEKGIPHLQSGWETLNLLKALIKETKPGGPVVGRLASLGLVNDEILGAMQGLAGKVQGDVSRFNVSRPGVGSLKWAENIKPSQSKPWKYNLGLASSGLINLKNDYEAEDKIYYKATGKHLDKLSEYNENDPLVKQAINAIKKGADINLVVDRLMTLRKNKNAKE